MQAWLDIKVNLQKLACRLVPLGSMQAAHSQHRLTDSAMQVTPVLGILLDVARRRQLPQGEKLWPKKVHLTYAMHHKEEATLLERPSIARAM